MNTYANMQITVKLAPSIVCTVLKSEDKEPQEKEAVKQKQMYLHGKTFAYPKPAGCMGPR